MNGFLQCSDEVYEMAELAKATAVRAKWQQDRDDTL